MIVNREGEQIDWGALQLPPTLCKLTGPVTAYASLPIPLIPVGLAVPQIGLTLPVLLIIFIAAFHYLFLHRGNLTMENLIRRQCLRMIGYRRRMVRRRLSSQCRSGFRTSGI